MGFITGLGLAELGHRVVGVDIAADKVEMLRSGRSPIYEEGVDLNEVLRRNLEAGRIAFTTDLAEGVRHGEIIFIAVGTPESEGGQADLSQVISVAENLLDYIDSYKVIVVKSTVPVGTVELVCDILKRRLGKIPIRRMGEVGEIGPLICYLASTASNFVTGSVFVIDGGESCKL